MGFFWESHRGMNINQESQVGYISQDSNDLPVMVDGIPYHPIKIYPS
jgi:hypothetical protein